jgi:hypothetical protein
MIARVGRSAPTPNRGARSTKNMRLRIRHPQCPDPEELVALWRDTVPARDGLPKQCGAMRKSECQPLFKCMSRPLESWECARRQ